MFRGKEGGAWGQGRARRRKCLGSIVRESRDGRRFTGGVSVSSDK